MLEVGSSFSQPVNIDSKMPPKAGRDKHADAANAMDSDAFVESKRLQDLAYGGVRTAMISSDECYDSLSPRQQLKLLDGADLI